MAKEKIIKRVRCPIRIDLAGGSLDIQPIPREMGPVTIVAAAINKYVRGSMYEGTNFGVEYELDDGVHTGSGLGTSGAMNLCWLSLISNETDKYTLANRVYLMEQATGIVGGVQDQFISAYGGVRVIRICGDRVWCEPLLHEVDANRYLLPHLLLVDSGIRRSGPGMNEIFLDGYLRGKYYDELTRLNELSTSLAEYIGNIALAGPSDIESIGNLIDEEWSIRKILMPGKVEEIDGIVSTVKGKFGGGIHSKINGQAGGGSILFWVDDPDIYGKLSTFIEKLPGCKVIDFGFDFTGLQSYAQIAE